MGQTMEAGAVMAGIGAVVVVAYLVSAAIGGSPGQYDVIPPEISAASNGFAVDFYQQVAENDGNLFFSPISIYVAFSMAGEGAGGDTAGQLSDAFGFEPDAGIRHNHTAMLMSALNQPDPHATLTVANSLWLAEWFEPHESYLRVVGNAYQADINTVDFAGNGIDAINGWAAEKTSGHIPRILEPGMLDASTAAAILNAVYFKGTWAEQFRTEDTYESGFWTGTQTTRADFMRVNGMFNHTRADNIQAVKLPYEGGRLSMLVLLPADRDIGRVEAALTPELITRLEASMVDVKLDVILPKFDIRANYNLIPPLERLGVTDLFDPLAADLSGMADGNLYVDTAIHEAYVVVNEEGTEAAAVTAMVLTESAPETFVADHPFIFIIQDGETILFMGRVSDPG